MSTSNRSRAPRVSATLTVVTMLVIALAGCGRRTGPSTSPSGSASSATRPAVAEPVLSAWQQGDSAGAIRRFLEADWKARPLFAPGSPLSLTEDQFQSLSAADREAKGAATMAQLDAFKKLARAVAEAGQQAHASGDTAQARKDFVALRQCGEALSSPESMRIVQLVGQALTKMADAETAKLGK